MSFIPVNRNRRGVDLDLEIHLDPVETKSPETGAVLDLELGHLLELALDLEVAVDSECQPVSHSIPPGHPCHKPWHP